MFFPKAALVFSSLVLLATAKPSESDASSKGLSPNPGHGRTLNPSSAKLMFKRDLTKRCTGTCEECFGDGYTLCPGSAIYCYLPGDSSYGLDSCSSDSSSSSSSDSDTSSSDTTGIDDLCYEVGATCQSCFGSSYLECPDGYHCYDPTDPQYDTCPEDSTSSSGGSSTSGGSGGSSTSSGGTTETTSSCAAKWGAGNIPCGSDGCYNPDIGESCCAGGYYCDAGYTCSSTLGKCSPDDDSSGSGSGSDGSLLTTTTSSPTSTSGLLNAEATTATSTGSFGSSTTGVSQISNSDTDSSDANGLVVGRGLLVVAAAGLGVLVM
ncbi:hypothetical protein G647_03029 [Cladophialophora carrionii CBS 160.54]|uniref:Uncharacterized protein n=1 Tax=Cladophialophora carrionii CBS 160.54 TaxID=1279043 RepID=V9DJY5_9EURO|nr:uncharacterized protein G647_03029 [Cladophialophora carrionii CBS 160.54]ETI26252.1 hypothetical protein G647_03029 [Cladophialophora carrionii CBS 160.54]